MSFVNDKKFKVIIPARGGSKGVPRKNIRILNGLPLIAYPIQAAQKSTYVSEIYISTDDQEIAEIAKKYGAEVPFMRPRNLATDKTPQEQVLLHAVKKLNSLGIDFEIFVYRDCTVPFIDSSDMNGAIELLKKSDCYSTCASIKAHPNPYFGMWEPNKEGFLKISKTTDKVISRRQDAPIVYIIDGLFVFWTKKFLKTRKCLTPKMLPYEISRDHSHMIDFEFDFKVAELLINSKNSH